MTSKRLRRFNILSKWTLVLTIFVMSAGSIVRSTGAGMGCPDWPKCFGHLIPPTDVEQITWKPNQEYSRNQMILKDEALWKAQESFVSGDNYEVKNWEKYEKHDYAIFNVAHTWTEYLNRLSGALLGIVVFALFVVSITLIRTDRMLAMLSFVILFLTGFSAWLGKVVVESNLGERRITEHMLAAVALLTVAVYLRVRLRNDRFGLENQVSGRMKWISLFIVTLSIGQILMGIGVREAIDSVSSDFARSQWIDRIVELSNVFYIHRSYSILILFVNGWFIYQLWPQRDSREFKWLKVLAGVLLMEVLAGIGMAYFGVPAFLQPIHLVLSSVMLAVQLFAMFSLWSRVGVLRETPAFVTSS